MPKRNIVKVYGTDQFYHIYNRGNNRKNIFCEPDDYYYFLSLFKRYLSEEISLDLSGRAFPKYYEEVELVAYCLMSNHFHMLCFLKEPSGIVCLMRSVMTAYTMYFNKKYKQTGKLYEAAFLASRIDSEAYLWQVSRYIHLNPIDAGFDCEKYQYSSLKYFTSNEKVDWICSDRLINDTDYSKYAKFVKDYKSMNRDMKYLKKALAFAG